MLSQSNPTASRPLDLLGLGRACLLLPGPRAYKLRGMIDVDVWSTSLLVSADYLDLQLCVHTAVDLPRNAVCDLYCTYG
jgi:hypothetical protein